MLLSSAVEEEGVLKGSFWSNESKLLLLLYMGGDVSRLYLVSKVEAACEARS